MSKKSGNIGAWADAEEAEAEEREAAAAAVSGGSVGAAGSQDFPSLKEAVSAKPKTKKMTLMEFTTGSFPGAGYGGLAKEQRGLTPEEMIRLPTGPKERPTEEMQFNRLGGEFFNYGGGRSGGPSRDRSDSEGSWGGGRRSYSEFDDERGGRPRSRVSDIDQPSRADEVDNWASVKKPVRPFDSGKQNRYGSLGGGGGGDVYGGSKADAVGNWMAGKKPIPSISPAFGSGFRDSGPEPDRWTRSTRDGDRERPRLVLDPPRADCPAYETESAKTNNNNKPNPFGAARPREEVLAEKGLDWKNLESDVEAKKTSRPTSEKSSSRPSSAQSSRSEGPSLLHGADPKARPKINPFGDAKPREVLLEERGQDWRKIDLELESRRVERPETQEEKLLKEEIDNLKKEHEKESAVNSVKESGDEAGENQTSTQAILCQKERELEILTRDLDEKVRFGKKERPGSAGGKTPGFHDRPPSQSGSFNDSRSDRPRSRGTGDPMTRSNEEKRSFQGSRDRGWFQNYRDSDRSSSRARW